MMSILTVVYLFTHNTEKGNSMGSPFYWNIVVAKPLVKAIKFNKQFNEIRHPLE